MDIIIELKDVRFFVYHGVSEQERKVGNLFVVNLRLSAPLEKAVISDDLSQTIDYSLVYEVVRKEMEIPSALLEHVGGRILGALKRKFPSLTAVELKLSKMNPPIEGDIHSASVIIRQTY